MRADGDDATPATGRDDVEAKELAAARAHEADDAPAADEDAGPGELLAEGRDAAIYAVDDDKVLRRFHGHHDTETEARLMEHLAGFGYPVPEVHAAEGRDMVIERLEGPTLLDESRHRPWRYGDHAAMLADLHRRLHRIPAPDFLDRAVGDGSSMLHLDLHPKNVVLSERGPIVIDWTSAARGAPSVDVALTWLILVSAKVPGGPIGRAIAHFAGRRFVRSFLSHFDHAEVAAVLGIAARQRLDDDLLGDPEREAVRKAVQRLRDKETRHGHPFELPV